MQHAWAEAYRFQQFFGLRVSRTAVHTADPQRHGHVVDRAELWQEVVKLVNKTQMLVAQIAQRTGAQSTQSLA